MVSLALLLISDRMGWLSHFHLTIQTHAQIDSLGSEYRDRFSLLGCLRKINLINRQW
jgi:hypothetical protein